MWLILTEQNGGDKLVNMDHVITIAPGEYTTVLQYGPGTDHIIRVTQSVQEIRELLGPRVGNP